MTEQINYKLPRALKPFPTLEACGNLISGGGQILMIGEFFPLLIGVGDVAPLVWLRLPSPDGEMFELVSKSRVAYPPIKLELEKASVAIFFKGITLFRATAVSKQVCRVDLLDLRPLGINIRGDATGIYAGKTKIAANSFNGGGALIGFEKPIFPDNDLAPAQPK